MYFYNQLYTLFGSIERFEKNVWDSRAAYALVGAWLVVVGVLILFGIWGNPTSIDASLE